MKYFLLIIFSIGITACGLDAAPVRADKNAKGTSAIKPETKSEEAKPPPVETPVATAPHLVLEEIPTVAPEKPMLFHWLVQANDLETVKRLVAIGQKEGIMTPDNQGRIPLHYAKSREMIQYLWNFTLGPSHIPAYAVTDKASQTPLHIFASTGVKEGVQIYLERFCRSYRSPRTWWWDAIFGNILNSKGQDNRTALEQALRANDTVIVEMLTKCVSVDLEPLDNFK